MGFFSRQASAIEELCERAKLIGEIQVFYHLGQMSSDDIASVTDYGPIRADLRELYAAAVEEAGERRTQKDVIRAVRKSADIHANVNGLGRGYLNEELQDAAERSIRKILGLDGR